MVEKDQIFEETQQINTYDEQDSEEEYFDDSINFENYIAFKIKNEDAIKKERIAILINRNDEERIKNGEKLFESNYSKINNDLSTQDSLDLIYYCIYKGQIENKKVENKNVIGFVGNTGSGKSTTINYIKGEKLKKIKGKEIAEDITGIRIIVENSNNQIAKIGHNQTSETTIPQVFEDKDKNLVLVDLAGFYDNRGWQINVSNIVNTKNILLSANSIKLLFIIECNSIESERGVGIENLVQSAIDLFGSVENFHEKKDSILILITKCSQNTDENDITIEDLRNCMIKKKPILEPFRNKIIRYDPLDREGYYLNQIYKKDIIEQIDKMTYLKCNKDTLNTILSDTDKNKLNDIANQTYENMEIIINNSKLSYPRKFELLRMEVDILSGLDILNHQYCLDIKEKLNLKLISYFRKLVDKFELKCIEKNFEKALILYSDIRDCLIYTDSAYYNEFNLVKLKEFYNYSLNLYGQLLQKQKDDGEALINAQNDIEQLNLLNEKIRKDAEIEAERQAKEYDEKMKEVQFQSEIELKQQKELNQKLEENMLKVKADQDKKIEQLSKENKEQAKQYKIKLEEQSRKNEIALRKIKEDQELKQNDMIKHFTEMQEKSEQRHQEFLQKMQADHSIMVSNLMASQNRAISEMSSNLSSMLQQLSENQQRNQIKPDTTINNSNSSKPTAIKPKKTNNTIVRRNK